MKKVALIGYPLKHSLSPHIYEYLFNKYDIKNAKFDIHEIHTQKELSDFMKNQLQDYRGLAVTMPYKEIIINYLDEITKPAKAIGAVNSIFKRKNKIIGHNTDCEGFITSLNINCSKINTKLTQDTKILVLGAGGAAKAIIFSLITEGYSNIFISNRSESRSQEIINKTYKDKSINIQTINWEELNNINNTFKLIINATSIGMFNDGNFPFELKNIILSDTIVFDIVYKPLETKLLQEAKSLKLITIDGLGMLIAQAFPTFRRLFNEPIDIIEDYNNIYTILKNII